MELDWPTIIASMSGTGIIVASISYALKRSFDRVLDVRLKEVEHRNTTTINESVRRQAALFDQQFEAAKTLLALAYRARNAARTVQKNPEGLGELRSALVGLKKYSDAIEELLFDERAVLPMTVFGVAHKTKVAVATYISAITAAREAGGKNSEDTATDLHRDYSHVETCYALLVEVVQSHLRLDEGYP